MHDRAGRSLRREGLLGRWGRTTRCALGTGPAKDRVSCCWIMRFCPKSMKIRLVITASLDKYYLLKHNSNSSSWNRPRKDLWISFHFRYTFPAVRRGARNEYAIGEEKDLRKNCRLVWKIENNISFCRSNFIRIKVKRKRIKSKNHSIFRRAHVSFVNDLPANNSMPAEKRAAAKIDNFGDLKVDIIHYFFFF